MLSAALSADNTVRRKAEETLSYASTQRGWPVALAKRLSQNYGNDNNDGDNNNTAIRDADPTGGQRLMAGMLLQHFVRDRWEVACPTVLTQDDKAQVSTQYTVVVQEWQQGAEQQQRPASGTHTAASAAHVFFWNRYE